MKNAADVPTGLLLSQDFFFQTRICDTARELGGRILVRGDHSSAVEIMNEQSLNLLLIDLNTSADLLTHVEEYIAQNSDLQIIAFGSHVEVGTLRQARAVGCHQVMPRSQFTQELASLLQQEFGC